MHHRLPFLAVVLGLAGLIPFILCGLEATSANTPAAAIAAQLLVMYGAIILSFLGGVHWGFTLASSSDVAEQHRLVGGVLPAVLGWLIVGVSLYTQMPVLALLLLIACYILGTAAEWHGHGLGLVPGGYITLRIGITVVVVAILTVVTVLRLVGAHLIF